jgi:hypothetical protein
MLYCVNNADASPTAIRITRPYASEEDYLEHEIETIARTGMTLLGAQERSPGVLIRFELALSTGQVLLRGEGRVVGFDARAHRDTPGLVVRFTRLDIRSKALIDKASAMRERGVGSRRRKSPVQPPAERESLLGRLRSRRDTLDAETVRRILQGRRPA